jgi:hypothetical protein
VQILLHHSDHAIVAAPNNHKDKPWHYNFGSMSTIPVVMTPLSIRQDLDSLSRCIVIEYDTAGPIQQKGVWNDCGWSDNERVPVQHGLSKKEKIIQENKPNAEMSQIRAGKWRITA